MINLKVKKLDPNAIIPTRGSAKASGLDLYALEDTTLEPGQTSIVKTGIAFQIPDGYEIQVRPRSGLSLKTSLMVANAPGTVDADYLGECCVIMKNISSDFSISNKKSAFIDCYYNGACHIKKGDRIAQAVLCPVIIPELIEVSEFDIETERGASGFGSTGK